MKLGSAILSLLVVLALITSTLWTGVGLRAAGINSIALLAGAFFLVQVAPELGRNLYLVGAMISSVGLLSFRSFLGRYDLGNIPGGFDVELSEYNRAAVLGSLSVLILLGSYVFARYMLQALMGSGLILPIRDQRVTRTAFLTTCGFGALAILYGLAFALGIGFKGNTVNIPFEGAIVFGLEAVVRVSGIGLLVHGVASRVQSARFAGFLILVGDMVVGIIGGGRGEYLHLALYLAGAYAVGLARTLRVGRLLLVAAIGLIVLIPVTRVSLDRRMVVDEGGRTFELSEFLALRVSGMNRLAPVVAHDEQVGWPAFVDTASTVRSEVYRLNPNSTTAIGGPAPAIGYLGYGIPGLGIVMVGLGALAALGDQRLRRARDPVLIGFHVTAAELMLDSVLQFRLIFNGKELIALMGVTYALRVVSPWREPPDGGAEVADGHGLSVIAR